MDNQITFDSVIDFAVHVEMQGRQLYAQLAEQFSQDAELNELFSMLARDEEHHINQFNELRAKTASRPPLNEEQQGYLRSASITDIFSVEKGIGKNQDAIETRQDALERAFNLEKASLFYYQAMKDVLEDDTLDAVIKEEKGHLDQVMKYMVTGAKMRGLGDKF